MGKNGGPLANAEPVPTYKPAPCFQVAPDPLQRFGPFGAFTRHIEWWVDDGEQPAFLMSMATLPASAKHRYNLGKHVYARCVEPLETTDEVAA